MPKDLRLDRFLAQATGLSRTQAQQAIRRGEVRLDKRQVVKSPSMHIAAGESVFFRGETVCLRGPRYFMLNKPVDVVCATSDDRHRTVLDLLAGEVPGDLHPVGRLDRDTTGLVLLTDDGAWSHRVSAPRHKCSKTYRVTLAEPLGEEAAARLREGILLKGESKPTREAEVELLAPGVIRLTLHEGRYHQVKRMLAAVGNHVTGLHRERIGKVALDPELQPGEYRPLTGAERESLASCGG